MQDHTMQHKKKMPAFRCLVIIIDSNIRDKLTEFLTDASIPIYYQMHGVGTVSSDFLNLCGLGDTHKTIMLCIVPKERTRMLLAEMNQALQLHKRGTGIAVSIPLSGIQGWLYKVLGSGSLDSSEPEIEKEVKKMSETITHAMILVTINHVHRARCRRYRRNDLKGSALQSGGGCQTFRYGSSGGAGSPCHRRSKG